MNGTAPYPKVVEVIGLTFFISTLESIVTALLQYATNSIFMTPSLAAFVSDFDLQNKFHLVMSKINIFTFWESDRGQHRALQTLPTGSSKGAGAGLRTLGRLVDLLYPDGHSFRLTPYCSR